MAKRTPSRDLRTRKVLLIDDDRRTRRLRTIILSTHGYDVESAESIQDITLPFIDAPDLVLLPANQRTDKTRSTWQRIREAVPAQRIGFLEGDSYFLCPLFYNGVLIEPERHISGDLIATVESMFLP